MGFCFLSYSKCKMIGIFALGIIHLKLAENKPLVQTFTSLKCKTIGLFITPGGPYSTVRHAPEVGLKPERRMGGCTVDCSPQLQRIHFTPPPGRRSPNLLPFLDLPSHADKRRLHGIIIKLQAGSILSFHHTTAIYYS